MSATDIVDVLRGGMWLLSDEQRREAADTIAKLREERDVLKARAEAAEERIAVLEQMEYEYRNTEPI